MKLHMRGQSLTWDIVLLCRASIKLGFLLNNVLAFCSAIVVHFSFISSRSANKDTSASPSDWLPAGAPRRCCAASSATTDGPLALSSYQLLDALLHAPR